MLADRGLPMSRLLQRIPDLDRLLGPGETVVACVTARHLRPVVRRRDGEPSLAQGLPAWTRATLVATPRRMLIWKDEGWVRRRPTGQPIEIGVEQLTSVKSPGSGPVS